MPTRPETARRLFGLGLVALGVGLAINTLMGPLASNLITYPFTETVLNEALGLEAVSLVLVAPLAVLAGLLALRGHRAAGFVAFGPTAYAAYMLVQYVVGPQYPTYQPSIALHLAMLVLSGALLLRSWAVTAAGPIPPVSRRWSAVLVALAAFVVSRWAGAFTGMIGRDPVPVAAPDLTMHWSIFMLDLGVVVPLAIAAAVGLFIGAAWSPRVAYVVVGWFVLVPPSVAAMAIVKILRGDPNATPGDTIVFVVVSLIVWLIAAALYRPLFGPASDRPRHQKAPSKPSAVRAASPR